MLHVNASRLPSSLEFGTWILDLGTWTCSPHANFTLPARDHHGRQAVAQHVGRGARHVHQRVDPEDDEHRLGGQVEAADGPEQDDARGTPATPLLVSISVSSSTNCWPIDISTPAACATKIAASERYSVDPSRLN